MNWLITVYKKEDLDAPPLLEVTIPRSIDKETLSVVQSNLKIAYEIMYNEPIGVEAQRRIYEKSH